MNLLILAAASLAVVGCARLSLKDQEFHAWKLKFGKSYSSPEEEARRKDIWLSTRRRVQAHNILADQGIKTYRMGMNQFSDMNGSCRYDPSEIGTTCTGYIALLPGDESELQSYVAYVGPVSVAVDADDFQHYESGIFYDPYCSSTQINHAVLVVGYGTERGQDYWLVKNSWGEAWGEHGYIRMSRNQDNQCGIASYASYPLV